VARTASIFIVLASALAACTTPDAAVASPTPGASATPRQRLEIREISADRTWIRLQDADVFLEADMEPGEVTDVVDVIDDDVFAVEEIFGFEFPVRPRVLLYRTSDRLRAGQPSLPAALVDIAAAIAFSNENKMVVVLDRVRKTKPLTVVRHELVHLMLYQVSGGGRSIPIWFHEGAARLYEETVPEFAPTARIEMALAASRAAAGRLPAPGDLDTSAEWQAATNAAARGGSSGQLNPYAVAAQYARLFRDDVGGDAGLRRLYEFMRLNYTFSQAFNKVTGRITFDIARDAAAKVRALVELPGAMVELDDGKPTLFVYGVPPDVEVSVSISAPGARPLVGGGPAGPAGVFVAALPAETPSPLTVRVTGPGVSFEVVAKQGR
jgi:hypothetical protein